MTRKKKKTKEFKVKEQGTAIFLSALNLASDRSNTIENGVL